MFIVPTSFTKRLVVRVFLKGHFVKKNVHPTTQLAGTQEDHIQKGEAEQTSLGGPFRHLKFEKNGRGGGIGGGGGILHFRCIALALVVILRCV